jgi:hypothetical protein
MTQKQVQEVDTLEEMVMLAELDEVDDLTEANNILTKVMAL